jgi:hypothetical protein
MRGALIAIRPPTPDRPSSSAGVVRAQLMKDGLWPLRTPCVNPAKSVFLSRWPRSDPWLAHATALAYIHSQHIGRAYIPQSPRLSGGSVQTGLSLAARAPARSSICGARNKP